MLNARDNVSPRGRTRIRYYWKSLSFLSRFTFIDPHDCEVETWRVSICTRSNNLPACNTGIIGNETFFGSVASKFGDLVLPPRSDPFGREAIFSAKKFEKLCAQELASELDALKTNTRHEIGNVLANLLNKTPENLCKNGLSLRFF